MGSTHEAMGMNSLFQLLIYVLGECLMSVLMNPVLKESDTHATNQLSSDSGSYTFSYDTGWTVWGRSYRLEKRSPDGKVTGEFGWVNAPGEKARVTFYSADKRGYRAKSIMFDIKEENNDEEKDLLIIGPIPPFLKDQHLAANPDAEILGGDSSGILSK